MTAASSPEPVALPPLPNLRDRGAGEGARSGAPSGPLGSVADARTRFAVNAASNLAYFRRQHARDAWYVPFLVRHSAWPPTG
jgi:hypothetical protein